MKGDRVKKVLREHKVKITELAQSLGESQSNTSALLSGADIKTGLLERISAATGIPISEFFGEQASISATMHGGSGNRMMTGTGNVMGDGSSELVATLKGEIEMLKGIIAEKNAELKDANEKINKFIDLLNKVTEAKV
uniref:helix-turn-helix domain-containing protein n=1 Tax=Candidatus Cryptobacteroides bacterium TaxID=3085639 RepID=UPI0040256F07